MRRNELVDVRGWSGGGGGVDGVGVGGEVRGGGVRRGLGLKLTYLRLQL